MTVFFFFFFAIANAGGMAEENKLLLFMDFLFNLFALSLLMGAQY